MSAYDDAWLNDETWLAAPKWTGEFRRYRKDGFDDYMIAGTFTLVAADPDDAGRRIWTGTLDATLEKHVDATGTGSASIPVMLIVDEDEGHYAVEFPFDETKFPSATQIDFAGRFTTSARDNAKPRILKSYSAEPDTAFFTAGSFPIGTFVNAFHHCLIGVVRAPDADMKRVRDTEHWILSPVGKALPTFYLDGDSFSTPFDDDSHGPAPPTWDHFPVGGDTGTSAVVGPKPAPPPRLRQTTATAVRRRRAVRGSSPAVTPLIAWWTSDGTALHFVETCPALQRSRGDFQNDMIGVVTTDVDEAAAAFEMPACGTCARMLAPRDDARIVAEYDGRDEAVIFWDDRLERVIKEKFWGAVPESRRVYHHTDVGRIVSKGAGWGRPARLEVDVAATKRFAFAFGEGDRDDVLADLAGDDTWGPLCAR